MNKEQRKKQFEEHLQQQNKLREAIIEEKKQLKQGQKNPLENMLYIQKTFKTQTQVIDGLIGRYKLKEIDFDLVHEGYLRLKEYYVGISYALNTYDRQCYKEIIQKMYNTIIELKNKFQPKKCFKFSRRDEDFGVKSNKVEKIEKLKQATVSDTPGLLNLQSVSTVIPNTTQNISSYQILDSSDCKIDLLQRTQILFLKRLKNCIIRAATTKSTVFVDDCSNCVFQLSCHQLRIHNTVNTTFGIFVTSKAIIEDCKEIKFKTYEFEYENRQKDEEEVGKYGKQNLWREIQDFNWLKENQKSPNYQLIEKSYS